MNVEKPRNQLAVVLLSGGLDSATTAAIALEQGYSLLALTVSYGQRHDREVTAAKNIAKSLGIQNHLVTTIDLRAFGGSALTDDIQVPKGLGGLSETTNIPVTYVPARNTILLSLALAFAESRAASDIFIGVNAVDYSGYPDCRPEFIRAFEQMAQLGTKIGVEGAAITIHAPLAQMTKADIIRTGLRLGVDYSLTHSCYDPTPTGLACGQCDSCRIRLDGFRTVGVRDPVSYS
ncbi:MAG: 7-cyano-7-deazaguanine synthase QueC [Planctomycetota bacterium]